VTKRAFDKITEELTGALGIARGESEPPRASAGRPNPILPRLVWPVIIGKECGNVSKAGERILASIASARAYARGEVSEGFVAHVPVQVEVKAIRAKLNLSQETFDK